MKAQFIGENGSMGLEKYRIYEIHLGYNKSNGEYRRVVVQNPSDGLQQTLCPYSSFEKLQDNWVILN